MVSKLSGSFGFFNWTKWTILRFRATVIKDIWLSVVCFTSIATMVSLVSAKTSHSLEIPNGMLTVLGTALALVLSFRTSSAYERYQEGRRLWTSIFIASRNLAQVIWIHVPFHREDKINGAALSFTEAAIEKKTMINLLQAFSIAVKHSLRRELGIYYEDLFPLICFLPKYASQHASHVDVLPSRRRSSSTSAKTYKRNAANLDHSSERTMLPSVGRSSTLQDSRYVEAGAPILNTTEIHSRRTNTSDVEKGYQTIPCTHPLESARNPPKGKFRSFLSKSPFFKSANFCHSSPTGTSAADLTGVSPVCSPPEEHGNVPLELILHLSSYFAHLLAQGLLQPAAATMFANNICMLQDSLANLERVRTSPLPFAYQVHLRISTWLYLFFLPFQLYSTFGYLSIPATTFASFLFLGFLEIGQEIENPFDYDPNDLDIDDFCLTIQRDLHEITAHPAPMTLSYIYTPLNQPFIPTDCRGADTIAQASNAYYTSAGPREYGERRPNELNLGDDAARGIDGKEAVGGCNEEDVVRHVLTRNWREIRKSENYSVQ
ncbi:hypothetical protein SERLA73DRAFT_101466 [Serpula lacrymans var. lacrymans S7.3]|uniref:Uncharacterized protein n=1 Tax=Serpula lacrymans var. lacrymans (strain S7.3) TaxID=936435 RepID=F8PIJ6_SERL3|nr:hypothetical protein SERLA73DRAFT_101466 [Serpula lacrymans var. lacrymans S7.3]